MREGRSDENRENRLLVRSAVSRAGVRMLGRPVFGRKRHTPESGARNGKFQAYFGFATTHRTEKRDMTFLFLFRFDIFQLNDGAAGDTSTK